MIDYWSLRGLKNGFFFNFKKIFLTILGGGFGSYAESLKQLRRTKEGSIHEQLFLGSHKRIT